MPTIADAQDAYLGATARYERWKAEFIVMWGAPQYELLMALAVQKIKNQPPQVQQRLQQMSPRAYNDVMKER